MTVESWLANTLILFYVGLTAACVGFTGFLLGLAYAFFTLGKS